MRKHEKDLDIVAELVLLLEHVILSKNLSPENKQQLNKDDIAKAEARLSPMLLNKFPRAVSYR